MIHSFSWLTCRHYFLTKPAFVVEVVGFQIFKMVYIYYLPRIRSCLRCIDSTLIVKYSVAFFFRSESFISRGGFMCLYGCVNVYVWQAPGKRDCARKWIHQKVLWGIHWECTHARWITQCKYCNLFVIGSSGMSVWLLFKQKLNMYHYVTHWNDSGIQTCKLSLVTLMPQPLLSASANFLCNPLSFVLLPRGQSTKIDQ